MQKNNIVLGLDMDGVILDHTGLKITLARNLGFDILPHQTASEIIKTVLPEQSLRTLHFSLYSDPDTCFATFVMRGAGTLLEELGKQKIPYYLISRRRDPDMAIAVLREKELWPHYFNEQNSFFVEKPEDKNTKARALGITHYLDDEPKVLHALVDVPHRFLFDPHNAYPAHDHYTAVRSLQEFKDHIA